MLNRVQFDEAGKALMYIQLEVTWLLRHLHITNDAIVPVLNTTRLKHIKSNNASSHKSGNQTPEEAKSPVPKSPNGSQNGAAVSQEEVKTSVNGKSEQLVEIMELSGNRKVCKSIVTLEKDAKQTNVVTVVSEIAKLFEQFFDV